MKDLERALADITAIRSQMARGTQFRGYGPGTGAVAVILPGAEMIARSRREHGGLADEMLYQAAEQYIPAGVAGTLIAVVLYRYAPDALQLRPGLGQIVFSLGGVASCRS